MNLNKTLHLACHPIQLYRLATRFCWFNSATHSSARNHHFAEVLTTSFQEARLWSYSLGTLDILSFRSNNKFVIVVFPTYSFKCQGSALIKLKILRQLKVSPKTFSRFQCSLRKRDKKLRTSTFRSVFMKHKFSPTLKLSEGFSLYAFRKEMNEIGKNASTPFNFAWATFRKAHFRGGGVREWAGNEEIDRVAAKEVTWNVCSAFT